MERGSEGAIDWLFEELWNTPKDKWEWNAILNKAKEMCHNNLKNCDTL